MTEGRIMAHRRIAASGPLVLRRLDGAAPKGYSNWGPHWAAVFPEGLESAELAETPLGIAIGKPKENADVGERITHFRDETIAALLPVPEPMIPVSGEGLTAGKVLVSPVTSERDRAGQIERHLAAMAKRSHAVPDASAFADLLLRQISVLRLPSEATVALQRRDEGLWLLEFRETGRVGCLLGDLEWFTPEKENKSDRVECRLTAATNGYEAGLLIATARAVQLAQLAVGSGLDHLAGIRVDVWNADLGNKKLVLSISPEDRGLAVVRLARQVAKDLKEKKSGQLPEWLPCRPKLIEDQEETALPLDGSGRNIEPLRWHGQEEVLPFRWVYSGDRANSLRYPQDLPFALIPGRAVRGFGALPDRERGEYLNWLSGPRRAEGCSPDFLRIYLQGLEYRSLADSAPPKEVELLSGEIRALRALADGDDLLSAQIDSLLDWLCATGKCPYGSLNIAGPLTCLVGYGRAVAQGHPLFPADLDVLSKVLEESGERNVPFTDAVALPPEGLILPPPQKPLAAEYVSISGICDQKWQVFLHEGQPLPDLRNSIRLRATLTHLPIVGEGSGR
jgi:hypothetical protein